MNYITRKEMAINKWGVKREEHEENYMTKDSKMLRLPFYYCNLSLKAASEPYCAVEKTDSKSTGNAGKLL